MEYTRLGRTGLKVSRLCLGTTNCGAIMDQAESFALMDKALELGINFFDTSNVYGGCKGDADTERIVGRWLAQDKSRREQIVLATKVYEEMSRGPAGRGLSAYHIRRACEDSLRRLQTDHVDIYQLHYTDRNVPWEEIWQAMEQLILEGKIIYVGSSNLAGWHIAQANSSAFARHLMGFISEQCLYNLATRTVELEVIPACRAYGMGLLCWSPNGGRLLAGSWPAFGEGGQVSEPVQRLFEKHRTQLQAYGTLCRKAGYRLEEVALAWLLHNPTVSSLVLRPNAPKQIEENVKSLEIELSDELLARLDEIWPGPAGTGEEIYAW